MPTGNRHVLSHTAAYFLARGVPGLVAFLSIPLFTRLLSTADYGRYALVIASVNLANAMAFQWLRLAMVRYLPAYRERTDALRATLLTGWAALTLALGGVAVAAALIPALGQSRAMVLTCWAVLAAQSLFELCCEQARAELRPWLYMALQLCRALAIVGLGALAITFFSARWWGPLAGGAVGMVAAIAYCFVRGPWRPRLAIDWPILRKVALYGVPLSLTVGLAVVISSSDRFLIAYFRGEDDAGVYSVAVDFATQSITLLLMVVYLAMFPLAVRAWEEGGPESARQQMRLNASLLLGIGVPCVAGLAVLSPLISRVVLGQAFRSAGQWIMPLMGVAALLAGLKAYHFDAAFQFAHRTVQQVWIVLAAAVLNIALNLIAIPLFGLPGSAAASIAAYIASIAMTIIVGRRHFAVPFPTRAAIQTCASALGMAAVLLPFRAASGLLPLIGLIILGAVTYGGLLVAADFLESRHVALAWLGQKLRPRRLATGGEG